MADKPTVFVVDDDPGALRSLCWLIQQADLPVRAFGSGREFLERYDPAQPGCLVLDVRMPEIGGLEVQKRLAERGAELPIVFLTGHGDVPTCAQAFRAGAYEFLEKPVDSRALLEHVRGALARDAQRRQGGPAADFAARLQRLTAAEKEVFDMLVAGKSLKDIAAAKGVTIQTAWRHRAAVLKKIQAENDVELARMSVQWSYEQRRMEGIPPGEDR